MRFMSVSLAIRCLLETDANLWATNIRPEEIRSLTTGDVHSLGINRVNVTLRNIAPFFEAFGITESDPMFRPESERVIIW